MTTVVGELQARHQLRVAEHRCHAVSRMKVVNGNGLVGARRGQVDSGAIQDDLDQRAVLALRAFEGLDVLPVAHCVNSHVTVLARRQDVLVIVLKLNKGIIIESAFIYDIGLTSVSMS